jgi:hypothetical protein
MSAIGGSGGAANGPTSVPLSTDQGQPQGGGGTPVAGNMTPLADGPVVDKDLLDPPHYEGVLLNPFRKSTAAYLGPVGDPGEVVTGTVVTTNFVPPPPPRNIKISNPGLTGTLDPGKNPPLIIHHDDPPQVMGVMTGDNAVAVIRIGNQQYVVNKGSTFGHGLKLKDVTAAQVEILQKNGTVNVLRVGARPPVAIPDQIVDKGM